MSSPIAHNRPQPIDLFSIGLRTGRRLVLVVAAVAAAAPSPTHPPLLLFALVPVWVRPTFDPLID
jgi:hypothetical protein